MTRRRDDSRLPRSERKDGRGHWPAGVVRSDLRPGVMDALRASKSKMSLRQMAAVLGVDHGTVWKWMAGRNQPNDDMQARILATWGCGV